MSSTAKHVPTFEQWNDLSKQCGGDLFQDADKLEVMRQVDRACGADVSWNQFCDRVVRSVMNLFDPGNLHGVVPHSDEETAIIAEHHAELWSLWNAFDADDATS